jgi:hypothetical protein
MISHRLRCRRKRRVKDRPSSVGIKKRLPNLTWRGRAIENVRKEIEELERSGDSRRVVARPSLDTSAIHVVRFSWRVLACRFWVAWPVGERREVT